MNTNTESPFGPVIYAYTRSQAAGKPLVRFDEGRSVTVIGLVPFNPSALRLLY